MPLPLLTPHYGRPKETIERYALGRSLGMDLVADPGVSEGEFLLQPIDNARADIAVRSYVVREDANLNPRVGQSDHLPHFGSAAPAHPWINVPSLVRAISGGLSSSRSSASSTPSKLSEYGYG